MPERPTPPGRSRPIARSPNMGPGSPNASSAETNPEEFVPIKGKKPIGIPVFPMFSKPIAPVPAPREKPHTEGERGDKPEPTPRKADIRPVKSSKISMSVSCDSIHHTAATVEQADNIENMERADQSQKQTTAVKVLPKMPGSMSMDNIRKGAEEPATQNLPAVPTPRKRTSVIKPRPVSMPPSELELTVPPSGESAQGQTLEPLPSGEIKKRLSGSAFALHIEDDAHALIPRELRGSKQNLAPKLNKPPKPGVKPKPILPSKPKPPAIAPKPKVKQGQTTCYTDSGEPENLVSKPIGGRRTTWYAASDEPENLMDFTSPKKPDPLAHGPTIIGRRTSKSVVNSETSTEQMDAVDMVKSERSDLPGATPFDFQEKTAAFRETKRPTIIKPLKSKAKKSVLVESLLTENTDLNSSANDSMRLSLVSEKASSNLASDTHSGSSLKANAQTIVDPPPNSVTEVPSESVSKPTILKSVTQSKPRIATSPTSSNPKGPTTAAKPLTSPKSRIIHQAKLSENIENESRHNTRGFSATSDIKACQVKGTSNNNQISQCDSCKAHDKLSKSEPEKCLACKNNDDEFYEHTCEKCSTKSHAASPRLAPIGFEGIVGNFHTFNIPQNKNVANKPMTDDSISNQPIGVQTHSPNIPSTSTEESNVALPQETHAGDPADDYDTSVTRLQSEISSQNNPNPTAEPDFTNLQASTCEDDVNRSPKVGVMK